MREIKLFWLVIGSLINNIAISCVWPLTSIYMHNSLGKSLTEVGVILLLYSGSNVLGSYITGKLFDYINDYWLTISGIALSIVISIFLVLFHGWPAYPIGLVGFGFTTGWTYTMLNSLGTTIHHKSGQYVYNMIYMGQNLGVVIGTGLVGFLYSTGVGAIFLFNAVVITLFLIIAFLFYKTPQLNVQDKKSAVKGVKMPSVNLKVVLTLFISLAIAWIVYEQWVSNLSVYMLSLGIPMKNYSYLWTVNAALIVVFQLIITKFHRYFHNLYHQVYFGYVFIGLSFLILIFARHYSAFLFAMVILTLGESTAFPAIPAIINALTPKQIKGKYQGLNNAWASAGKALGPLIGGIIIDNISYLSLFAASLITCLLIAGLSFILISPHLKKLKQYEK